MEELDKMKELLVELSQSGTTLPGLDVDSIINNIVETQYASLKVQFPSEEEADAFIESMQNYVKTNGVDSINSEIVKIKTSFKQVKDSIQQLTLGVQAMITSIALPPSIPGVQNPLFSLNEALSKFNTIKGLLNQANTAVADMISSAIKINYPLPEVALILVEGLAKVDSILNLDFGKKIKETEEAATQQEAENVAQESNNTTPPINDPGAGENPRRDRRGADLLFSPDAE